MSHSTVAVIAGKLMLPASRHGWRGDCPLCAYPRAFSLRAGRRGQPLAFCANGCAHEQIREALARLTGGLWRVPPPPDREKQAEALARKAEAARRVWAGAGPVHGTPAEAYLCSRGLGHLTASPALRWRTDVTHPDLSGRVPAMLASVTDAAGMLTAVHRTYLLANGRKRLDVEPRASLGPSWGGAVRLSAPVAGNPLVIGEGIETSASAGRLMNLPAWAAISAGNLGQGLALPREIAAVIIAADPDGPGERAAREAALRWSREGRAVRIARPCGAGDFNDLWLARGAA